MRLNILIIIVLLFTTDSYAYLGPGVGGGVIAATIGVLVAIIAGIFGILWFPFKRLIKKSKENNKIKKKES